MCTICFVVTLMPKFDEPAFRPVRGIMFIVLGVSTGMIFVVHRIYRSKVMKANFILFLVGGLIYILGATIYMLRVPERWRPGTFDLCGASHQIFHFCVIIACCIHFYGNVITFRDR